MANKKSSGGRGGSSSNRGGSSSNRGGSKNKSGSFEKQAKREAAAYAKSHKKAVAVAVIIIVLIIIAAIVLIYIFKPEWLKFGKNDGNDEAGAGRVEEIASADLSIHFLELGSWNTGDCTLIKLGDTEVLIDAGAKANAAPTKRMTDYIDKYCTDGKLEYVIATHAHEDHIAGFVGQGSGDNRTGILYKYEVGTIITFSKTDKVYGTDTLYTNFVNACTFAEGRGAKTVSVMDCWNGENGAARTVYLDEEHKVSMNFLYQKYYENKASTENEYSVCMLLKQEIEAGVYNNYIFTGDLEKGGEQSLVDNNALPECVLYKGGHHGSKTSSNECLMSVIKPKHIAVCCCAGTSEYTKTNANQFPTQDFVNRVAPYTDSVYITTLCTDDANKKFESMNGDIVFYVTEKQLKLWCSNNTTKLKDTEWFKNNRTCPAAWAS